MPNEFEIMREIGKVFGVSSHTVGRKLKELGLRTTDGKPSSEAFARGLVERKFTDDRQHYLLGMAHGKNGAIIGGGWIEVN